MGTRLLAEWLLAPLTQAPAIEARLDAVQEFTASDPYRGELRESLDSVGDLQRLASRASTGRATPRDLVGIARTLRSLPAIKAKLAARRSALIRHLDSQLELCPDLRQLLDTSLVDVISTWDSLVAAPEAADGPAAIVTSPARCKVVDRRSPLV